MKPNVAAAKAALAHIEQDESPAAIRSKCSGSLTTARSGGVSSYIERMNRRWPRATTAAACVPRTRGDEPARI